MTRITLMRSYQGFNRQSDALLLNLFEYTIAASGLRLIEWLDGTSFERRLEKVRVKGKPLPRHRWNMVIKRFEAQGYLKQKNIRDRLMIHLTNEGLQRAWKLRIRFSVLGQKSRQKELCVVVFDIPEDFRKARNTFRYFLKECGFKQLQRSVWVCPISVTRDMIAIIEHLKIHPWVRIINGTIAL